MAGEKAIQLATFVLLLVGLCSLSAWVAYAYLVDLILQVSAIALSWGATILVLYVVFKTLDWDWWNWQ